MILGLNVPTVPTLFRPFPATSERLRAALCKAISHFVPTVPTFSYTYTCAHTPARAHMCGYISKYVGTVGTSIRNHKQIKNLRCSDLSQNGRNKVGTVGTRGKSQ